ncbi:MAG: trypsin-like peptidase domain-containing protein [Candidatus Rokubacteria bacterium]|nr:trypsin-like peptidase domain-containing protein [Candidatus Rokubacteria bacterium]
MNRGFGLGGILLVAAGCAAAPVVDRGEVVRRILPSIVQLRVEREAGGRAAASGVVFASDAATARSWIVTTRHLLDSGAHQRVYVRVPPGRATLRASVVATSPDADLAVLAVEGVVLPPVQFREDARLGDEVWVVAFPWGRRLTVVSGVVSQIVAEAGETAVEGPAAMVDASVSYGASGGGVFDAASGALIGIVEGYRTARMVAPEARERALEFPVPGETLLIPARAIRRFLGAAGLETLTPK